MLLNTHSTCSLAQANAEYEPSRDANTRAITPQSACSEGGAPPPSYYVRPSDPLACMMPGRSRDCLVIQHGYFYALKPWICKQYVRRQPQMLPKTNQGSSAHLAQRAYRFSTCAVFAFVRKPCILPSRIFKKKCVGSSRLAPPFPQSRSALRVNIVGQP